jgi:hypothetical protein
MDCCPYEELGWYMYVLTTVHAVVKSGIDRAVLGCPTTWPAYFIPFCCRVTLQEEGVEGQTAKRKKKGIIRITYMMYVLHKYHKCSLIRVHHPRWAHRFLVLIRCCIFVVVC